jgi:hypothetical protein
MLSAKIRMERQLWQKLIKALRQEGKGRRETGAFLLGTHGSGQVTHYILYNELDPHAFDSGIIIFEGDGYIPLWQHCYEHNQKVLADVHTHPGEWTGQSVSDQANPMVAQQGHIALIIPVYAKKRNQLLKGVGIHEFLGNREWKSWESNEGIFQLIN